MFTGRWSYGPHVDGHFSSTSEIRTSTPDDHKTNKRKVRKEDILQEHRQILSHLDDIMLRARAAMTKSVVIDKELGIDSLYQHTSRQHSGERNAYKQSPQQLYMSESDLENQNVPNVVSGHTDVHQSCIQGQCSDRGIPTQYNQHSSSIEHYGTQNHSRSNDISEQSPGASELHLAQVQPRKQELLQIQQEQNHAIIHGLAESAVKPGITNSISISHQKNSEQLNSQEDSESKITEVKAVKNGIELNIKTESIEKSPKIHPDDRKPKLSGTDITELVHKNYEAVLPGENQEINSTGNTDIKENAFEKSLPTAEDFLKSLAEMKLSKHLISTESVENKGTKDSVKLNAQQLAQLGEHFKRLGIDTRPFQDLLGSPSNTRVGKPTAFQPVQPKLDARKQLTLPENPEKINNQPRASADGEEAADLARPPVKQGIIGNEKYLALTVAPKHTERDSRQQSDRENFLTQKLALQIIPKTGAISQGAVIGQTDNYDKQGAAIFTPIEPHPITNQIRTGVPVTYAMEAQAVIEPNAAGNQQIEETENPMSSSLVHVNRQNGATQETEANCTEVEMLQRRISGKKNPASQPSSTRADEMKLLKLNLANLSDSEPAECNERCVITLQVK